MVDAGAETNQCTVRLLSSCCAPQVCWLSNEHMHVHATACMGTQERCRGCDRRHGAWELWEAGGICMGVLVRGSMHMA